MKYTPRVYQKKITDFIMSNARCNIFAGMGTGKTVSTLAALNKLNVLGYDKALIIAPLRVARSTWIDEVNKWDYFKGLKVSLIVGSLKERQAALAADADIYTTNYENLPWLVDTLKHDWFFNVVVCDESSKLKGFRLRQGGKRTAALAKVAHTKVERFINLTGTPTPNSSQDLFGQCFFIDRGQALGTSYQNFNLKWFIPKKVGSSPMAVKYIVKKGADEEIQSSISHYTLTVRSEDYFDLEKPIQSNIEVTLPDKVLKQYKQMEKQMLLELEQGCEINATSAASKTMKCLQIANGAIYDEEKNYSVIHDLKLEALESLIEESGENIIVCYKFKSDLARLIKRFPEGKTLDKKGEVMKEWNNGEVSLLFIHPASAGHGISLQNGGRTMCFFSQDWSNENRMQAMERIGATRQAQSGFKRAVYIYDILAKGTLDYDVQEVVNGKRTMQEQLLYKLSLYHGK